MFGQQQADFWIDVPDGVAQAVATRLRLWTGSWFLNTAEGTDWSHKILANNTALSRDAELRQRVLNTPGATQLNNYSSSVNPNTRAFSASFQVDTQFGPYAGKRSTYYTTYAVTDQPPAEPINVTVIALSDTSVDVDWTPYVAPLP